MMQLFSVVYLRVQQERSALHIECFGKLHLCLWVVAACCVSFARAYVVNVY